MKRVIYLMLGCIFLIFCSPKTFAQLVIKSGDIKKDGYGYFYEYELNFTDLATGSTKFEDDISISNKIDIHKTPTVPLPDHPDPRWIYPSVGVKTAGLEYCFDFSGIQINVDGIDYYLSVDSVHLWDKVALANNNDLNEQTTVVTEWSVDGSNYFSFTSASTPLSIILKETTGDDIIPQPGYVQTFYYRVTFTNSSLDGFDANINRWNSLQWSDTDHFAVVFRLHLIQAPPGTYEDGDGSELAPFQIATVNQLEGLSQYPGDWDKQYILVNDINMKDYGPYDLSLIAPDPIASLPETWFTGSFDGNGHVIHNLIFETNYPKIIGLFGGIGSDGQVSNLSLEDCIIRDIPSLSGLLAGYNYGTIINCQTHGAVLGSVVDLMTNSKDLGGMVGINNGFISHCCSTATVIGFADVGGLVGSQIDPSAQIYRSCSHGLVHGGGSTGGLCGYVKAGSITESFADTEVIGSYMIHPVQGVGGLVGYADFVTLSDCFSHGHVHSLGSASEIGGLVGYLDDGSISNSYFAGRILVQPSALHCGALIGKAGFPVSISNCFYDNNTSGIAYGHDRPNPDIPPYFMGFPTYLMQQDITFSSAGWDFTNIWDIRNGATYPHFQWENACYDQTPADINNDCVVNFVDFAMLANYWLECYALNPIDCP